MKSTENHGKHVVMSEHVSRTLCSTREKLPDAHFVKMTHILPLYAKTVEICYQNPRKMTQKFPLYAKLVEIVDKNVQKLS